MDVADALARAEQTPFETESWDWKHGAWYQFEEQVGPRLLERERQLLNLVVHGRPIFGRRFVTGWEFYTYLSQAEARALREAVSTAIAAEPLSRTPTSRSLAEEFVRWIDQITNQGLDVWVRAE